jgi:hypothetical protein
MYLALTETEAKINTGLSNAAGAYRPLPSTQDSPHSFSPIYRSFMFVNRISRNYGAIGIFKHHALLTLAGRSSALV